MATILDRAKTFFKIDTKKENGREKLILTEPIINKEGKPTGRQQPVKFSTEYERMFEYYLSKCTISRDDIQKRENRNKLLRTMYYENTIIYLACEMLANESVAVQDNTNFITVKSKSSKLSKKIYNLLNLWDVNQNTAKNQYQSLYLFGDSFKYRKITERGIEGFNYLDVDDIKQRIEYNPLKLSDEILKSAGILSNNYQSIANLVSQLSDKSKIDMNNMLDSRLLGWELTIGMLLPPWCISHARLYSSESDFFPYGRSLFINSLSAFLQLKASKNLMVMARANNFPTEVIKVKAGEGQTETEKWNALNRFTQNYNNLTSTLVNKEEKGIKSTIITLEGLYDYSLEKPDMDLDQIADIEMLEMDLIRPTAIPLELILGKGGGFSSGKLLSTQSLFFNRKVQAGQSAFLENLMEDIKLHLYLIDDPEKDEDFELEMFSPQAEQSDEYFSSRKSSLELVSSIMDTVKTVLGIENEVEIPENIAIELFSNFSFLDPSESKKIIKAMYQARNTAKDIVGGEDEWFGINNDVDLKKNLGLDAEPTDQFTTSKSDDTTDKEEKTKLKEHRSIKKSFTESHYNKLKKFDKKVLTEIYFNSKKAINLTEGTIGNRRFITSSKKTKELTNILSSVKEHLENDFKVEKTLED